MAFLIHLLQELKTKVLLIRVIWVPQIPLLYQVRDWILVTLFFPSFIPGESDDFHLLDLCSYFLSYQVRDWLLVTLFFPSFIPGEADDFHLLDLCSYFLLWIRATSSFCGLEWLPPSVDSSDFLFLWTWASSFSNLNLVIGSLRSV